MCYLGISLSEEVIPYLMDPDSWCHGHRLLLKGHLRILGPINQKLSMLHCSFAAPFNICCSCFELFWLLGHKVQFFIPSFPVIPYSVHVKQIVASFIILYFPSHSCSLLCNVIIILLQHITLHQLCHKLITFFIISGYAVQGSRLALQCAREDTRNWNPDVATNYPRAGSSSPAPELTICFFSASPLDWCQKNEDAGRCRWRCADAFDVVPVLKVWKYNCAVLSLTSRSADGFVQIFGLIKRKCPRLFLLREVQREYVCIF